MIVAGEAACRATDRPTTVAPIMSREEASRARKGAARHRGTTAEQRRTPAGGAATAGRRKPIKNRGVPALGNAIKNRGPLNAFENGGSVDPGRTKRHRV